MILMSSLRLPHLGQRRSSPRQPNTRTEGGLTLRSDAASAIGDRRAGSGSIVGLYALTSGFMRTKSPLVEVESMKSARSAREIRAPLSCVIGPAW